MTQTHSPSPEPSYQARQDNLITGLQEAGLETLVLTPGPSLSYLTGLSFHLMERPVVAIFASGRPSVLILPELETAKAQNLAYPTQVITFNDNPDSWPGAYSRAAQSVELDGKQVGVEPRGLRFLELRLLQNAAPGARFVSAEETLANLRIRKDEAELSAMRKAVEIAQHALHATLPMVRLGMRESELASELTLQLLRLGSQPELPFSPIVSFGPNSANPHAVPSDRQLAPGDLLLLDWGAAYQSYISDLTRTFAVGEVDPELKQIAQVVADANAAGREAIKPGVTAGQVDQAARTVIEKAGYGAYFTHRTGHGIGRESHEAPYLYTQNALHLAPGMTFTVEPGIYLPGRGGVRIEDNVVVTQDGGESLSDLPRELLVVGV